MTYDFSVVVDWYGGRVEVTGSAADYTPAKTDCPNDKAHPAEGRIEHISKVRLVDEQGNWITLPTPLQDEMDSRIIEYGEADEAILKAMRED